MAKWRPEGWLAPWIIWDIPEGLSEFDNMSLQKQNIVNREKIRNFEAGADALLDALRKTEINLADAQHWWYSEREYGARKGKLVFLPDDTE